MTADSSNEINKPANDEAEEVFQDFLHLPSVTTIRIDAIGHILLVRAMYEPQLTAACPECGQQWSEPRCRALEPFWDWPRGSSPVLVQLLVPVITCDFCSHTLDFFLPWLHATREMTYRLEGYIADRAATFITLSQIARETGQDLTTVIEVFMMKYAEWERRRGKNLPRVLKIDEIYFNGKLNTLFVNGDTDDAVELLPSRRNSDIRRRLMEAGNRDAVEYVVHDFYDPFRAVTTRPPALPHGRRKTQRPGSDNATMNLFDETPEGVVPQVGGEKYAALPAEALTPILPNAVTVGEHYHFAEKIEQGLDRARLQVQRSLRSHFTTIEWAKHSRAEIALRGREAVEAEVKANAIRLAEDAKSDLTKHRYLLFKRPENVKDQEWLWLNRIFADHPVLQKAWEAKNRGLAIFPVKPPLGRSRKSRRAARETRAALLMTPEEAARKLDAWIASIDGALKPYYQRVLNLIATWREEIIRIGTTPFSNGGTESKNRFVRMMEAVSRGLSPEVRRARLLWADAHRRTERWPECLGTVEGKMTLQRFVELADAWLARQAAPSTAAPIPTIEAPVSQPDVQRQADETSDAGTDGASASGISCGAIPDKKPVRPSNEVGRSAGKQDR